MERFLTTCETANYLGIKSSTLESWRSQGKGIPYVRISPRIIRYRQSDLDQWIKANTKD